MKTVEGHLFEGEEIVYTTNPAPFVKPKNNIFGKIILAIVLAFLGLDLIAMPSFSILTKVIGLIFLYSVFSIIKDVLKKAGPKKEADDLKYFLYVVTNMRVIKYNFKKDEIEFGYLDKYNSIAVASDAAGNYGELIFGLGMADCSIFIDGVDITHDDGSKDYIIFRSIKDPYQERDKILNIINSRIENKEKLWRKIKH